MTAQQDRVALVTASMVAGGAERVLSKLASGIAERGAPVDLVLGSATGPFLAELHPGVRVVDLDARRMATAVVPLARYLRRERPAAVVTALDFVNVLAVVARALSRTHVPLVVSEHNTLSEAVAHATNRGKSWMPRLIRWSYPHADGIVAVSRGVADDLVQTCGLAPGSVTVLNNPIVSEQVLRMRGEPVGHPWLEDPSRPVFVAVGRLMPQKDFATLIEAFALARRVLEARLVILGDGPSRTELETLASRLGVAEDVSLPGFCANPYPAMAAASAFVLSSRWEGSPTVLVEALACGTPVVATDCPSGPREILDGGRHGLLVPVGDADALAAALVRVVEGEVPPAAPESWAPFTQGAVVDAYLGYLSTVGAA